MKLPVKPKGSWEIIDANGVRVCIINTGTIDRDQIIQAINSREKLLAALKRYGDHEPGCVKGDACNCGFEQALKEKKQ